MHPETSSLKLTAMLGTGIIKGLAETARNFVGSYHDPARLTTRQYQEERPVLPENARSFPSSLWSESVVVRGGPMKMVFSA